MRCWLSRKAWRLMKNIRLEAENTVGRRTDKPTAAIKEAVENHCDALKKFLPREQVNVSCRALEELEERRAFQLSFGLPPSVARPFRPVLKSRRRPPGIYWAD